MGLGSCDRAILFVRVQISYVAQPQLGQIYGMHLVLGAVLWHFVVTLAPIFQLHLLLA